MRIVLVNKAQKIKSFRILTKIKVPVHSSRQLLITPYHIKKCYIILIVFPLILVTDRPKLYANCFHFSKPAQAGTNIYQQDSVMN